MLRNESRRVEKQEPANAKLKSIAPLETVSIRLLGGSQDCFHPVHIESACTTLCSERPRAREKKG